ncbi:hypothetical protein RJ639_001105 [Escallonia herrerae]|uniref:Uncharacterized protein n=1 Tax=Escallonia herrerae TaxID=1293975 RepID=A0AA88XA24_9ASTE|nr:hypothetical protein RJ639_001105 [Escallonia herrerae]
MGLGYVGYGGSSSSSNLSPLAPPFTVDRSNSNPNSNPLVHFTEPPYAAVPFNSWQYPHSSSSRTDFYASNSDVDSIRTASLPSASDYGTVGLDPINPPNPRWAPLDASAGTNKGIHSFSYLGDPKPYYPPYASPVVNDDAPLMSLNEANFDSLVTSGLLPMDGSSRVDYTQTLTGLEYPPQWGGFWNGLAEGKRGKRMDVDGSFCSEETNITDLLVYNNYAKKGAHAAEGLGKADDNSATSHGIFTDVSGRGNRAGSLTTGQLDDKSFLVQNPIESSRNPILGSGMASIESATWNRPKPSSPYNKGFQLFDSFTNDCISGTKSFPSLVIRSPDIGTTSVASINASPKSVGIDNVAAVSHEDVLNHNLSEEKASHLILESCEEGYSDTDQLRISREGNDHLIFVAASSAKEELSNKLPSKNDLHHVSKLRSEFQIPDINVPDGCSLTIDSTEAIKSIANSSDSLDSPCWKGAPAAHFSPFEDSKAASPQLLMKDFEACSSLNPHGTPILPLANDPGKVFLAELGDYCVHNKNVCVNTGFLRSSKVTSDDKIPTKEHKSNDTVKPGSDCRKLSNSEGIQSLNDIGNRRNEDDLPSTSKSDSDSRSSHPKPPNHAEACFTSREHFKPGTGNLETRMISIDASKDSFVPAIKSASYLPSSGGETFKPGKPHGGESPPKMDVQMLVKSMQNLSELLLFYHSNHSCGLNGKDHEALMHVVDNLEACMSRKNLVMSPPRESVGPQQGPSHGPADFANLLVGGLGRGHAVTNITAANPHNRLYCQLMPEENSKNNLSVKEVEKIMAFVPSRDDAGTSKDRNMIQAIKTVLNENFHCEEEFQSQSLLYKNLWLEAEAELCSTSFRARFDRVKVEMEKCKLDRAKDVSGNTMVKDKILSSNVDPDPNITHSVTPESNDNQIPNIPVQNSPSTSSTSRVNDVEASVMARFQILKCRGDASDRVNVEKQHLTKAVDAATSSPVSEDQLAVGARLQCYAGKGDCEKKNKFDSELQWRTLLGLDKRDSYMVNMDEPETVKEFPVCGTDDSVIRPTYGNNRLPNQLPSGWYDNSSSDWEDVLKDDFAWQS